MNIILKLERKQAAYSTLDGAKVRSKQYFFEWQYFLYK